MTTWAIISSYGYTAVEVIAETPRFVRFVDTRWHSASESRRDKNAFLPWRGNEDAAKSLAAKLNVARDEYNRRTDEAADWFKAEKAKILGEVS